MLALCVQISDTQELVGELEDIDILLSEYENDPVYHAKAKVSQNASTWDVVHQSMLQSSLCFRTYLNHMQSFGEQGGMVTASLELLHLLVLRN